MPIPRGRWALRQQKLGVSTRPQGALSGRFLPAAGAFTDPEAPLGTESIEKGVIVRSSYVILLAALAISRYAQAMEFEVWRVSGEPAIIGTGPIVEGDAKKLQSVLNKATQHSGGYYALALDSPGGSVK